jgi:hypothetical protein
MMVIEGMTRFYACPRVDILNGAGIRCIETPVGANGVDVSRQVYWVLIRSAVEALFLLVLLYGPKRVSSSEDILCFILSKRGKCEWDEM